MSKLFDQRDYDWEIAEIGKAEQRAGTLGTCTEHDGEHSRADDCKGWEFARLISGFAMARLDGARRQIRGKEGSLKSVGEHSEWDKLRARSRMKLLRSGQLMSDLRGMKALCKRCPGCSIGEDGNIKGCDTHRSMLRKCIMAVKYAGEENMPTRLAQGRVWGDDEAEAREANPLNAWERWYSDDKKAGQWTSRDAKRYDVDWNYLGWLEARLEDEEITFPEYVAEKERIREALPA